MYTHRIKATVVVPLAVAEEISIGTEPLTNFTSRSSELWRTGACQIADTIVTGSAVVTRVFDTLVDI